MKRGLIFIAVFLTIIYLNEIAFAKIPVPGRTNKVINDYAGVINEPTKKAINALASSIKQETPDKVELIVAIFKSLEGWQVNDFALAYGENWRKIKEGRRDNGVILLVVLDEGRVTIGVGQNIKNILTDAAVKDIIKNDIIPEFKKGNLNGGIEKASEKIINILNNATIPADKPIFNLKNLVIIILAVVGVNFIIKIFHKNHP
jgi:uncharacterized protein